MFKKSGFSFGGHCFFFIPHRQAVHEKECFGIDRKIDVLIVLNLMEFCNFSTVAKGTRITSKLLSLKMMETKSVCL